MHEIGELAPAFWQAIALSIARWIGFSVFVPLFGRRHMGAAHRNAICLALALPAIPGLYLELATTGRNNALLVFLALKEVALGALLGMLVSIPFWIFRGGLTLVDNQRGANAAQMANPSMEADSSILGELGERMLLVWLIETGSFVLAFEVIVDSFQAWPVLHAWPEGLLADASRFWEAFAGLMSNTFLFAAPALLLLLAVEYGMALSSTSVKGIDVYQTAMPIKSLAALLLIALAGQAWFARWVQKLVWWWQTGVGYTLGL